jgi:hypothetical protein
MSQVKISQDGQTAYLEGPQAIVSVPVKETEQYAEPSSTSNKWSPWGSDNLTPQNIIEAVEKNVVASSGLEWLIDAFYGSGIITYKRIIDKGKERLEPIIDKNFEEFRKNNDFNRYIEESLQDFVWFKSLFPEMKLNKYGSKKRIEHIFHKEAFASRWGLMNEKTFKIEKLYYSYEWSQPNYDYISEIPVFDPKNPERYSTFVLRIRPSAQGRVYYNRPAWHSIVDSKWLDISNNIPGAKQSLLANNMSLKYHIRIPANHWERKYTNWKSLSPEEQKTIRTTELTDLNNMLTGQDNVMKSFISHFGVDKVTGKEIPGWEILKIDSNVPDGALSTDLAEANAMILFGLNIDPTLKGAGLPNSKQSAGSGSDKRTAFNIYRAQQYRQRQLFFQPLYFIRDFNGWDPDLRWGFKDTEIETLDNNPTSTNTGING